MLFSCAPAINNCFVNQLIETCLTDLPGHSQKSSKQDSWSMLQDVALGALRGVCDSSATDSEKANELNAYLAIE
jgi:hypothetical protein